MLVATQSPDWLLWLVVSAAVVLAIAAVGSLSVM
jgi:hypothetical protein